MLVLYLPVIALDPERLRRLAFDWLAIGADKLSTHVPVQDSKPSELTMDIEASPERSAPGRHSLPQTLVMASSSHMLLIV